jgi:hypothetical protein
MQCLGTDGVKLYRHARFRAWTKGQDRRHGRPLDLADRFGYPSLYTTSLGVASPLRVASLSHSCIRPLLTTLLPTLVERRQAQAVAADREHMSASWHATFTRLCLAQNFSIVCTVCTVTNADMHMHTDLRTTFFKLTPEREAASKPTAPSPTGRGGSHSEKKTFGLAGNSRHQSDVPPREATRSLQVRYFAASASPYYTLVFTQALYRGEYAGDRPISSGARPQLPFGRRDANRSRHPDSEQRICTKPVLSKTNNGDERTGQRGREGYGRDADRNQDASFEPVPAARICGPVRRKDEGSSSVE